MNTTAIKQASNPFLDIDSSAKHRKVLHSPERLCILRMQGELRRFDECRIKIPKSGARPKAADVRKQINRSGCSMAGGAVSNEALRRTPGSPALRQVTLKPIDRYVGLPVGAATHSPSGLQPCARNLRRSQIALESAGEAVRRHRAFAYAALPRFVGDLLPVSRDSR